MGLDFVVMEVEAVSNDIDQYEFTPFAGYTPLFLVPHTSHSSNIFRLPEEPSSKLPQSVQKTNDPMAAISCL